LAEGKHRADTSKRVNPAIVVLPLIGIALAVGAYLIFVRGDDGAAAPGSHVATTSAQTPPFAFHVDSAVPVPSTGTTASRLRSPAKHGAAVVAKTMSGLYAAAFLDPANWQAGEYDPVWSFFAPPAAAAAKGDAEELTAGSKAGGTFNAITPDKGTLDVKVLFDERNKPVSYSATVVFSADASNDDGTHTKLFSKGTFFLQPTSRGWRVSGFDVSRDDHPAKGGGSSTASATAGEPGATP
jgi:hypothetical protein